MEKSSFYDIDYKSKQRPAPQENVKNISEDNSVQHVSDATISSDAPRQFQGENNMAEIDTTMLSGQHADIRRETAIGFGDVRYNIATESCKTNDIVRQEGQENVMATKDARHDVINEVDRQADRLDGQATSFYIAGQTNANIAARDLATLTALTEANATAMRHEIGLSVEKVGAASALQAEKIASAVALGQSILSKEIFHDGQKTRDLINDLKYHDLNRSLVERQTELLNCNQDRRHYRDRWDDARFNQIQSGFQGQWAQLQSQIQAFQSQLQETRQGMVNFGTMAGVGQTSTSNNVR